ncbi:DUF4123 domain-containing protein [Photobacterium arenosum]|uniref:DUF4123 domain-containing protein n=1 Tax=Photobacterium arenosum TaxID=2774143 RepID=UPI0028890862|nr:DUF4123 domain-containing protein [Photobacterium arenosum]
MSIAPLKPEWQIQQANPMLPASDQNAYVLFEPLLWPDWQTLFSEDEVVSLFSKTRFSHLDNGPLLVPLTKKLPLWQRLMAQLESTPCGCLLVVPDTVSFSELTESLRERLIVSRGRADAVIRYYEPRKLLMLVGSMSSEQRQQFFPKLHRIHWFDQYWLLADWHSHAVSTASGEGWVMSDDQINTMMSIAEQWQGETA